ncbi:MAG: sodium/proline symporter PutP [Thermoplasmata archaeon]|nr:sodium/proline symporter PutP [Thermoplasmata archaeon]
MLDAGILAAIVIYFVAMLAIGVYFLRSSKTTGLREYFLGGRKMNPYVTALSAQASDMSGWMLMGLPGAIVVAGMGQAWIGIGLAVGSYLCWLFAAKRLRKHSVVSGNAITMPEFFSNRFHDDKGYLRLISTVIILFLFTIYVASGFKSCGAVLEMALGIGLEVAIIVGVVITVAYTMMGGYKAVCWADFTQAILMVICVVVVPIAAINAMGGWGEVTSAWDALDIEGFTNLFYDSGEPITVIALVSALAWGLGYFGMPHIVIRYMSIRNPNEIKIARRVSLVWIVIALSAVVLMALVGRVYFAGQTPGVDYDAEHIFLMLSSSLFAPFVCGIMFAAILAAIMSTVDSQLLVATSSITNDIMSKSKRRTYSDSKLGWVSRVLVVVISVIAALLALYGSDNIMGLVSYAWSGFGAAFGPLMILALFWKRMNLQGAMASMVVGFATVILWESFMDFTGLYSLLPGFVFAFIAGVAVAMMTPPPSQEIQDEFDEAQVYEEPVEGSA